MPRSGGAFLGQGVGERAGCCGVLGDGVGCWPLGMEAGEGFLAAQGKITLGVTGVEGPGDGAEPEAMHFLPVVGGGGLWGLSKARLRPRELAADMK